MPSRRETAREHYRNQERIGRAAVEVARREWRKLDSRALDDSFYGYVWPQLISTLELGQLRAAEGADDYLDEITGISSPDVLNPRSFSGVASDGRSLESLLEEPLITTKRALRRSESVDQAQAVGETQLALITASETADAGRTADGAALVARPELQGYVRLLSLPSCSRCVVLAGEVYRWSDGFERHPRCDCRHVPVGDPEADNELRTDPRAAFNAGKVRGLSKGDRQAIADGADISQVVNARRGMDTAGGRKVTREGTSRRGWAGMAMAARRGKRGGNVRLRPETIYAEAGSRNEAISMLRDNGYFVDQESI